MPRLSKLIEKIEDRLANKWGCWYERNKARVPLYAVLGGIGSLPGAMLGGLLIGIVQSGANTYINSSMSDTFVYLILIVVLMIRPAGILGKNVGEKV